MEGGMVGIRKLCGEIPRNNSIVVDPPVWNRAVSGVDHTDSTTRETENRGTDVLNGVILYIPVKQIFLARIDSNGVSHQEPHQVHHVNNLFYQLSSRKVALPPPGRMQ